MFIPKNVKNFRIELDKTLYLNYILALTDRLKKENFMKKGTVCFCCRKFFTRNTFKSGYTKVHKQRASTFS